MSYWERKLGQLCTHPGCDTPPLIDHLMCRTHRDWHRLRNRHSKQAKRHRRTQLAFVHLEAFLD